MGYPSGDVEWTFTGVGVVLSRARVLSALEYNGGLCLDEVTQREGVWGEGSPINTGLGQSWL